MIFKKIRENTLLFSIIFIFLISYVEGKENTIQTIERHIVATNDDAEEYFDGIVNTTSSDLEITYDGNIQTIGLRFVNITIPKNAKIINAYIQFEVDEVSLGKATFTIYAEDTLNPRFFLSIPFDITKRKKSKRKVIWKPASWSVIDQRLLLQQTADFSTLVQYIIDKKDWYSGNSMAFIIKGVGKRVAKAYIDDSSENISKTAALHIDYIINPLNDISDFITLKNDSSRQKVKGLVINEILTANTKINQDPDKRENSDWIELYNKTNIDMDISNLYLSNNQKNLRKWKFPKNTMVMAHQYLTVWADNLNDNMRGLHTNFKLKQEGNLFLSDSTGNIIDQVFYPKQQPDISFSYDNGFMHPTPNRKNSKGFSSIIRTKKPLFSISSGFYKKPMKISLSGEKNATIYYTIDSTTPTKNSIKYSEPIELSKTTVLRAVAFHKNKFESQVVTHTYFFDENISLPSISLVCDKKYLYDRDIGIIVNYNEHWMRKASIEYFKDGKSKFLSDIGLKVSGNNTRKYHQKSFAIYFKKKYGKKSLKYSLFPDKTYIKKVKSFTLRTSGTYIGRSLISEGISHLILKDNMDIDYQSYHPVILFLNGKFWGIYSVRERMNKNYIKSNHSEVEISKIDLIENDEDTDTIKEGNIDEFYELIDYVRTHNMRNSSSYEYIKSKIDITEFINHNIVESYFGNSSIQHNVKRWKEKNKGKWRTMLFDLDRGFDSPYDKVLGYIMDESSTNILFTNLIQNKNFTNNFLSQYFTHLNTTFKSQRVDKFIDRYKNLLFPYIDRHFKKWEYDENDNKVSKETWIKYIDNLYYFSHNRANIIRKKLKQLFNLKKENILFIEKPRDGYVYINDIKLSNEYRGKYFKGAVVRLKAVSNKNWKFKNWSNGNKNRVIDIVIKKDINITAYFVK